MLEVTGLVAASAIANGGGGAFASSAAVSQALMIGRGGAALIAASSISSLTIEKALSISAGGATSSPTRRAKSSKSSSSSAARRAVTPKVSSTSNKQKVSKTSSSSPWISSRAKAVFFMAVGMSFHYLGYSLARPITISLFTSAKSGYAGLPAAFPFAMAFVSPMSLLLLLGYGKVLDKHGPRGALIRSTILCAFIMSASAIAIETFETTATEILNVPAAKFISGPLFVFRESYVQLLTSQYWSFMASALTPTQSAKWFGPIAGLTSITSAVAGFCVSSIIDQIGISYSLLGTGLTLLASLFAVNIAYNIAEENGFSPSNNSAHTNKKKIQTIEDGMFQKATKLFTRVPILWKLFIEILASQGLATILNVAFVARLQRSIPNDAERAGWVGKFFSTINLITMVLQFGILPPLLSLIEPKIMWRVVPLVALVFTSFQAFQADPSLYIVSATLLVMKVLEYSARRMLDEMVFVPLDFESRFLGKEVIGVFGYRFGKSLMSLGLSGLSAIFGNFGIQEYSILSALVNLGWLKTSWSLSLEVPTRKEAEEIYQARNKKGYKPPSSKKKY